MYLPVVELQYNDIYVRIDAIKIISLRIKKNYIASIQNYYTLPLFPISLHQQVLINCIMLLYKSLPIISVRCAPSKASISQDMLLPQ